MAICVATALLLLALLAGCGGGAKLPTTTAATQPATGTTRERPPVGDTIDLRILGLLADGFLPARYTCDGADTSMPVRWSGVPHGTEELVLFILNIQPVHGKPFVDWSVAGLSPGLHGIPAGRLPLGAVVGRNTLGRDAYSICPERGQLQLYIAALFALPHRLALRSGYDSLAVYQQAEHLARAQGLTSARYESR